MEKTLVRLLHEIPTLAAWAKEANSAEVRRYAMGALDALEAAVGKLSRAIHEQSKGAQ